MECHNNARICSLPSMSHAGFNTWNRIRWIFLWTLSLRMLLYRGTDSAQHMHVNKVSHDDCIRKHRLGSKMYPWNSWVLLVGRKVLRFRRFARYYLPSTANYQVEVAKQKDFIWNLKRHAKHVDRMVVYARTKITIRSSPSSQPESDLCIPVVRVSFSC